MKSSLNSMRNIGTMFALLLALTAYSPAFAEGEEEKYFDSLLDAADKIGLVDEIKDKLDPTKAVRDSMQEQSEALQAALKDNAEGEVLRLLYEKYGYDTAEKAEAAYKKITATFDTISAGLEWTDYAIGKYSQIANGQYEELAVDLWKEGLNKAATSEMAKEIFAKLGIGSNVVGLAIKALELTADSYIALNNETKGVKLESLYGSIESDKTLFKGASSGRKLGEGNPIPVSREAVDYLYNRIVTESGFRNKFQIYYEQQLSRTFPTPDFFSSMWIAYQTGGGAKAGSAVAEATQEALKKNRDELEEGIRALLAQLNAEAKMRESAIVAKKQIEEMKRLKDKMLTLKVQARLRAESAKVASGQVPAMQAFLAKIPADIQEARKAKNADKLGARRANIVEFLRGPVKALPQGAVRRDLVAKFRSAWVTVSKAKTEILKDANEATKTEAIAKVMRDNYGKDTKASPSTNYGLATVNFTYELKQMTDSVDQAKSSKEIDTGPSIALLDKAYVAADADLERQIKAAKDVREKWRNSKQTFTFPELQADGISWDVFLASFGAAKAVLASRHSDLRAQYEDYAVAKRQKLLADERAIEIGFSQLSADVANFAEQVTFGDAIPFFDSLKPISYAGLPRMSPPKWDALYPTKLLQYLTGLKQNVEKERDSLGENKGRWEQARQRVERILAPGNKPAVVEYRRRLESIRSLHGQRRLPIDSVTAESIERNLKFFEAAHVRAGTINFKQADDQAGQPDVEISYIQGLINQVETIASLLSRYSLISVKHRGTTVTLATQGSGIDMGLRDISRVMNADQVKQLQTQLLAAVDAIGFSSFDQKAEVGLRTFINTEFAKYQNAFAPSHLAAFYSGSELNIVTDQDFSGLLASVNSVTANSNFVNSVNDKLNAKDIAALDMSVAYGIGDKPPTFNLGKLQQLQSAKDGQIQTAVRAIQSAIDSKISEYMKWQKEEAKRAEDNAKMVADCSKKGGIILDGKCANIGGPGGSGVAQNQPPGVGQGGGGTGMPPTGGPGPAGPQARPPVGQQFSATSAPPGPAGLQAGPGGGTNVPGAQGATGGQGNAPGQIAAQPSGGPGSQSQGMPVASNTGSVPPLGQTANAKPPGTQPGGPAVPPTQVIAPSAVADPLRSARPSSAPAGLSQAPTGSVPPPAQSQSAPPVDTAMQKPSPTASAPMAPSGQPMAPSQTSNRPPAASGSGIGEGASRSNPPPMAAAPSGLSSSIPAQPAIKPSTPAAAKPVDKELEAQWKEMNKADSKPPIAMATPPAAPKVVTMQGASGPVGPAAPLASRAAPPAASPVSPPAAVDATPAVREIYQKLAEAYQRKDARGITKYLAPQWQGPGGASSQDFEDGLASSFKNFDTIQFKMDGLQVQKSGTDSFNVSYSAVLSAKNSKQNLKVDDRVNVQDVVKITGDGPRIFKTTGSIVIKPK